MDFFRFFLLEKKWYFISLTTLVLGVLGFTLYCLGPPRTAPPHIVLHKELPFYGAFAENSLRIDKGKTQEALEHAVALKEEMAKKCPLERFRENPEAPGAILYTYNLIRIASLQKKLENLPGEKSAWKEVEEFLGKNQPLLKVFKEKELDLTDYIAERKKHF